ncbi:MAG: phenylalanine--tRNA ligase subunit beta [Chloroflexi bacterium]|nr:phenylalanine--tRNA ligase subunit beta [Chloroflexota bacterium]
MKVSLNWLKDYVNLNITAQEVAYKLTMSGNDVDTIQTIGREWANIYVGQITDIQKHPNADRLQLTTIDVGKEQLTVVCGAPNIKIGYKVPFARLGAVLFDAHTGKTAEVKAAKIRGVHSEGMACSERELGISQNHEGILILSQDAPLGMPLAEYMGDSIFDIKVTPNRADCLSIIGIARELSALTGEKLKLPGLDYRETDDNIQNLISIEIADADLCYRYCASVINNVVIEPSPLWMQQRLLACGMRPINNIVDITNYVMLECGQPLHAFDYSKIRGKKIIVRRGKNEDFVTLDNISRKITPDMLLITDNEGPVAIAGVMGGAVSEIDKNTKSILLESASFNRESIRRTATSLKLRSEASLRFEKGLSPELSLTGLKRATQLMINLAQGKAASGIADVYPVTAMPNTLLLTSQRVSQVLGMELNQDTMSKVLASLGFECTVNNATSIMVTVPYWRVDIKLQDDLIEELARTIGYDRIPTTILGGEPPAYTPNPMLTLKNSTRDILAGCGMQEVINTTLTNRSFMTRVKASEPILLTNPLSSEQECLRTSLRAGLLLNVLNNERYDQCIELFEIGHIYLPRINELPEEPDILCGILTGSRMEKTWLDSGGQIDFFDVKGILETLFDRLGVNVRFEKAEDTLLLPGRTSVIKAGNTIITGIMGEVDPLVIDSFGIHLSPVYLFEIYLETLATMIKGTRKYKTIPRYPGVTRDLSLVIDTETSSEVVQRLIKKTPMINSVTLFDVYTGEKMPAGKKALAYSIVYQSPDRTLTDTEVNKLEQEILNKLNDELGVVLRQ